MTIPTLSEQSTVEQQWLRVAGALDLLGVHHHCWTHSSHSCSSCPRAPPVISPTPTTPPFNVHVKLRILLCVSEAFTAKSLKYDRSNVNNYNTCMSYWDPLTIPNHFIAMDLRKRLEKYGIYWCIYEKIR